MSLDAWLTLAVIVVLFGLLVWDRWPTWAVFAGTVAVIITLDLASEPEALAGFANSGVLSVVVLFVVAAGMYRTGAISLIISKVVGMPSSEREANLKIQPLTATGSAFLNNTPIVAMLVPVIEDLGRSARLSVSKLYMAVSDSSILGGAATLIGTSTNLIIAGLVLSQFGEDLGIFFPTRIGLPAAIIGVSFVVFIAPRLLKDSKVDAERDAAVVTRYRAEFFIPDGSSLVGKSLAESGLAVPPGAELVHVSRGSEDVDPVPDLQLEPGDVLTFDGSISAVTNLWTTMGLVAATPRRETGKEYAHRLAEGVVSVTSDLIGSRVGDADLGEEKVVAISSSGVPITGTIADYVIVMGDNIVLEVEEDFFDEPHDEDFALVKRHRGYRVQRVGRAVIASLIVLAMVLLSAFGVMSLLNAALLASIALLATGCLSFRAAWRSIDWTTYVILGSAIALEPAVTNSGLADTIADGLGAIAGDSVIVSLAVVFIGCIVLTNLVTNSAAAALMFPITVGIVVALGVAWQPFVAILMLGCSYAFINPAGYQTHLMVMEPGGYKFADFVKVGVPLTILLGVVVVPLAWLLYPV